MFCRREGVSTASFHYWRRRVGERFVEMTVPRGSSLIVEVGRARVEVPVDFDADHLRAVVDALR